MKLTVLLLLTVLLSSCAGFRPKASGEFSIRFVPLDSQGIMEKCYDDGTWDDGTSIISKYSIGACAKQTVHWFFDLATYSCTIYIPKGYVDMYIAHEVKHCIEFYNKHKFNTGITIDWGISERSSQESETSSIRQER